ncbi:MAG: hypothetical protein KDB03_22135 [Planctomycetales bacterium]|nr:hypothetical protein [Planctomycetales bacterium]
MGLPRFSISIFGLIFSIVAILLAWKIDFQKNRLLEQHRDAEWERRVVALQNGLDRKDEQILRLQQRLNSVTEELVELDPLGLRFEVYRLLDETDALRQELAVTEAQLRVAVRGF